MPIIKIVAFRGVGGVLNSDNPYFDKEPGLVRAGHVGLEGVIPGEVIGFAPTSQAVEQAGGEQALLNIVFRDHIPQDGSLQNHTDLFFRALELIEETNGKTVVWELEIEVSESIIQHIQIWYNKEYIAVYNAPRRSGVEFEPDEYNCATFPDFWGVPIPANTGKLEPFIEAMIRKGAVEWRPDNVNH